MTHHLKLYPPWDYESDTYRDPGKDSTVFPFLILGAPLVLLPVVAGIFGIISVWISVALVFEILLIGFLNDFIHDSFHVKGHWVRRYWPGYERLNRLHFAHHVDMQKNFGIFIFAWDAIFGTIWEE